MTDFEVVTTCGVEKEFDSRSAAEEGARTHETLCEECDVGSSDISPAGSDGESDDSKPARADGGEVATADSQELPQDMPDSVETDPLDIVPGYMLDTIEGKPAINKRGYAVIANRYDIGVTSEALTLASDTNFEHAEFKAIAIDEDGNQFSGHGSAHVDRNDDKEVLNEMAETRAMKRAVSWASGFGINAFEELVGILETEEE